MESIQIRLFAMLMGVLLVSHAVGAGTLPACKGGVCFINDAGKLAFEKANGCTFQSTACASMNAQTQCCVNDPNTHQQTLIDKQITKPPASFSWNTYVQECPNMRQSDAPPDALWKSCVIGKIQDPSDPTDFYTIIKIQKNASNPNARPYCIDGCSTPPGVVQKLYHATSFLTPDRENPSGYPGASFETACSNHDICYQTCSKSLTEAVCDDQLLAQSEAACGVIPRSLTAKDYLGFTENVYQSCLTSARRMHNGLWWGGKNAFQTRREQYCKCC